MSKDCHLHQRHCQLLTWSVRRIRLVKLRTLACNHACGWSGHPIRTVYLKEHVVKEPANYPYTWLNLVKEPRTAMVLRVSSMKVQWGLRKRRGALGVVLGTSQYRVRRIGRQPSQISLSGNVAYHLLLQMSNLYAACFQSCFYLNSNDGLSTTI